MRSHMTTAFDHPRWATRRSARRHRGQAIVEFALVAPVFFLMFFGVVEYSLINASIGSFNFAAKNGARLGSLLGRTDPNVDQEIVAQIRNSVSGVVAAQTTQIEIYKSDNTGAAPSATAEDIYDITGKALNSASWPPENRNDSLDNADYLGVRISYVYTYITSLVAGGNSTLRLTAQSVQRIEPQDFQGHLPPTLNTARAAPGPVGVALSMASRNATVPQGASRDPSQPMLPSDDHGGAPCC